MAKTTKTETKPTALPEGVTKSEEYVVAEIEQRHFSSSTGEKLSNSKLETFNPIDWRQFQEHGPRQGWSVLRIIEAPENVDLTYHNPGRKK